jgi:hypothetical protein
MHRMTCRLLTGFALAIFMSVAARAQQPTSKDALLDHLAGSWILEGTIADEEAIHDVTAEWILDYQYLRIHEVSRDTQPDGRPAYEANFFIGWDPGAKQYACVWLDTSGRISSDSIANAKRNGDEISFIFKDKDGVLHLTFAYNAQTDSWEWRLESGLNSDDPFARVTLIKQN